MIPWWLGLGNDEKKYAHTPHNIGFQALDVVARRFKLTWKDEKNKVHAASQRGRCAVHQTQIPDEHFRDPVFWAAQWWHVPVGEVVVVCDDFSLPWGKVRIRRKGSSGGHNGLDSVIQAFNTEEIARLRIGVGPVPRGWIRKILFSRKWTPKRWGNWRKRRRRFERGAGGRGRRRHEPFQRSSGLTFRVKQTLKAQETLQAAQAGAEKRGITPAGIHPPAFGLAGRGGQRCPANFEKAGRSPALLAASSPPLRINS
jgi:aminoacyl-tRNA hydrolase